MVSFSAPAFDPYGYDTSYDTGYMEDYSGYGYAEDGGYYGGMGAMGMPRPPVFTNSKLILFFM